MSLVAGWSVHQTVKFCSLCVITLTANKQLKYVVSGYHPKYCFTSSLIRKIYARSCCISLLQLKAYNMMCVITEASGNNHVATKDGDQGDEFKELDLTDQG